MEKLSLNAEVRTSEEKNAHLRAEKLLPGVVYGNHQEPISLKLNYPEFLKLFRKSGESHIISLKIGKKSIDVLVHDFQKHPVTGDFTHVDFYAITKGEVVSTKIHLEFIGESQAVREGAILEEHMKEIEVKCQPADLVDNFEVDLSKLVEMGDSIRVSDLGISDKYDIQVNANEIVAAAAKPAKVENLDAPIEDVPVTGADEENTEEK
ncbi:50S ribosomal protein L25 [Candidatus Gracilibacteria bacterium]|nr:50S ribosomal protein L25 [Candidatus Gracilibacteria bacterium]